MIDRLAQLWKFRGLVGNLTRVELLVKYRGSVLGLLWSLLNPLLMMFIYLVAFKYIMRLELENYTFYLLVGLLPWGFFATSVTGSTMALINNGTLLKKVQLPREVFPVSGVAFHTVQLALTLVAFLPFTLAWKDELHWFHLLSIPVLLLFVAFTLGACMALSALTTLYRDLEHFTEIAVAATFWFTPIVYNFEMIPENLRPVFLANPVTLFMNCLHDILYWDRLPGLLTVLGVCVWTLVSLWVGSLIFRRIEPQIAERV